MSTQQNSNVDTSTSNANWGTLVIVLLVVIIGVVVGWITLRPHTESNPVLTNPSAISAPQSAPK